MNKPTFENTDEICKWVLHYYGYQPANMSQPEQWLYKLAGELQAIRSAELPVEPKHISAIRSSLNYSPPPFDDCRREHRKNYELVDYIDALKSFALKLPWLFTHCKAIGMTAKSDSGKFEDDIALFTIDLKLRAEKAESELAALKGRLMEPDEEMIKAGSENITSVGTDSHIRPTVRIWKAMAAVAMKEGK